MKKNKPLRAAGILLLATMLTTCMTAGTFAKYTTSESATDSARVAKFGVTVTADGTLYGEEYNDLANGNGIIAYSAGANTGTVQVSATGTNVVAPGTKNDTGLGFSINGKPEVDVKLDGSSVTTENIYLKQGTYGVMIEAKGITSVNFDASGDLYTLDAGTYTKANAFDGSVTAYYKLHDSVTLGNDYYPVIYTLTGDTSYNAGTTTSDSLAAIATLIEGQLIDGGAAKTFEANTDLTDAGSINFDSEVLTWEWAFERDEIDYEDGADTILGDLAATGDTTFNGTVVKLNEDDTYAAPTDGTDYNLKTSFDLTLTVTQID